MQDRHSLASGFLQPLGDPHLLQQPDLLCICNPGPSSCNHIHAGQWASMVLTNYSPVVSELPPPNLMLAVWDHQVHMHLRFRLSLLGSWAYLSGAFAKVGFHVGNPAQTMKWLAPPQHLHMSYEYFSTELDIHDQFLFLPACTLLGAEIG